ncbi:MAG: HAMP domain-containing histidine kinase [Streptosporangiaceae bacterium]|nr:HAMP domain-containing histidine kinase [Streptosporangiaceae bacterium]
MMRRIRLRTQVLAGVLSITLLALVAFDIAAVSELHRYLVGRTNSNLRTTLTMIQPQLDLMVADALASGNRQTALPGGYDIAFLPAGQTHPVVLERSFGNAAVPTAVLAQPAVRARAAAADGSGQLNTARKHLLSPPRIKFAPVVWETMYQAQTVTLPAGTLVAGASLSDVNATVARFRLIIIIGSAAAGVAIFGGVVLVMRRGLRPIEVMAAQAGRITAAPVSAGSLARRVQHADARSEVGRLGTALNEMLTRIEADVAEREASQELMRRFFADASHELRTPLASLRANAELYQQGALPERAQVDEAMRRIALEAQRMSRLVDDMLGLARLDQHPARQHEPVDLAEVIETSVEHARIADPTRTWRVDVVGDLTTTGDEELLRRAIDNLLANVRTHTPTATTATVTADVNPTEIMIEVADDGPGVPDDQLPRVFDRFHRAGAPSRRPGSGLGLAIVAEIAAVHGGTAIATSNYPHGLRVAITLPVEDASTAHNLASAVV